MNARSPYLIVSLLLLTFLSPVPTWADFQAGIDAYNRGDYATALREWRPLAEQGDARAQLELGFLYHFGYGVPQDYTKARQWYERAAAQGDARAQLNLGALYDNGQGAPQDYVLAYMWFNLAAPNLTGDEQKLASDNQNIVARRMTPAQIAEAQKLAREWKPKQNERTTR